MQGVTYKLCILTATASTIIIVQLLIGNIITNDNIKIID